MKALTPSDIEFARRVIQTMSEDELELAIEYHKHCLMYIKERLKEEESSSERKSTTESGS